MGKRKGGLTGLSRFVLESFRNDPAPQSTGSIPSNVEEPKSSPRKPEHNDEIRPTKRQKTQTDNVATTDVGNEPWPAQWVEKYDATGLVPHYTNASEVPEHLKKCTS